MASIASLPTVAVDESGNTGQALLDSNQWIFALGSTSLDESSSAELIRGAVRSNERELKFSSLRKSAEGRRIIFELMKGLAPETAKVAVVNKPFMVVAKVVDDLVEPLAAMTNFNLYGDGAHIALTETWHAAMPSLLGEERYVEMLKRFVSMSRHPSPETVADFYDYIERLLPEVDNEHLAGDLELILVTRQVLDAPDFSFDGRSLDPAIPCLVATASAWGDELGVPFVLVHDQAKVIEEWLPNFAPFLFDGSPPVRIGQGDRSFTMPLLATSIELVDSAANTSVQLADVIAGASRTWVEARARPDLARDDEPWQDLDLLPLVLTAVWPTGDITPDVTAGSSVNPADEMAAYLGSRDARR